MANGQALDWVKQIGGAEGDIATAVEIDSDKNLYITGQFEDVSDFDPGPGTFNLTAVAEYDAFACKLDSLGNLVWAVNFGGPDREVGQDIAVDANGNVYVCGGFRDSVDFDPGPGVSYLKATGSRAAFIVKLDANGNFIWAKSIDADEFIDFAIDNSGSPIITGAFTGTVDFDPGINPTDTNFLSAPGFNKDVFLLKLSPMGNFQWAKNYGGADNQTPNGMTVDGNGLIYISGQFNDSFVEGADSVVSQGGTDAFVSKHNSSGNMLWVKRLGGSSTDIARKVHVDGSGNVITTGVFQATADFDPGSGNADLTSNGSFDLFISNLDASGNYVWAKSIGGTGNDGARGIDIDGAGNIVFTGIFEGTVDFNPGAASFNLSATSNWDVYVCKLMANGDFSWAAGMGGFGFDTAFDVVFDGDGNTYAVGDFEGLADFDPGAGTTNLTSKGSYDIYVQKLNPTPIGLNEENDFIAFDVYPNPSKGCFRVELYQPEAYAQINVSNSLGQQVYKGDFTELNSQQIELNVSPGIYFLTLNINSTTTSKKLVIN